MGLAIRNLDEDLHRRSSQPRSTIRDLIRQSRLMLILVAVTVSFLFDPLEMGHAPPEEVVNYYRHGDQALMVYQGNKVGLLLPFVASF